MITRILDTDLDSEKRYVQNLVYIIYMYILYMIFRTCTLLQSTTGPMDPGLGKNRKTHLTNMLNDLQLSNENKKTNKKQRIPYQNCTLKEFPMISCLSYFQMKEFHMNFPRISCLSY